MKPAIAHRDASPSNDEQPTPDEVLSVEEAAVLLRIGRDTLYAEVAANRIPHRKLGKLIRFSRTALDQRVELAGLFCTHCGVLDPRCQCWNDE